MSGVEQGVKALLVVVSATVAFGLGLATVLRRTGLMWGWAILGIPLALLVWDIDGGLGMIIGFGSLYALLRGSRWHRADMLAGAAPAARPAGGVLELVERFARRQLRGSGAHGWISSEGLEVGRDEDDRPTRIPVGGNSGCHTLVLGATGSGKTVTETWVVCRLIEAGHGAIVIDPKGDPLLRRELANAAEAARRRLLVWTPQGELAYNPYAHGTPSEIADKALAGEHYSEPHYLRQAQRYLAHAVRAMQAAQLVVSPATLMEHLDSDRLEATTRGLGDEQAEAVQRYVDALGERQRRELAGVRDRLSILAESDVSTWLEPGDDREPLDLVQAVGERLVVYFRLDSDRRPLLSQMLAAAIVGDLVTLVARHQRRPVPTTVLVDEFAAVAAQPIGRLFARSRSAGISLVLGTQELADLKAAGENVREQVLGNVEALIAHRQNVPESAELIANIAGTRQTWIATQQTDQGLLGPGLSGRGSVTRGHEYEIHPTRIKRLPRGTAAVITPGRAASPVIAHIHHPGGTGH